MECRVIPKGEEQYIHKKYEAKYYIHLPNNRGFYIQDSFNRSNIELKIRRLHPDIRKFSIPCIVYKYTGIKYSRFVFGYGKIYSYEYISIAHIFRDKYEEKYYRSLKSES